MTGSPWRKSSASTYNGGHCAEVGAWRKARASMSNGQCAEVGAWRKSAASSGYNNCAEIGAWRKSSASITDAGAGSECAEVGAGNAVIGVRDTKQAHLGEARTVLEFSPGAWNRFLTRVRQQ
jgi:hypothetical protein